MKTKSNPALERETLYAKSQVYIRRGLRAQGEKDSEEYQLWSSFALELLGKAALSSVHPALVADPTHFQSLFAACGRQLSPDIKTITAKTLFERLGHLEKSFDARHQRFCEQMALRRNSELHSGESPFSGMSPETWEREFWGAVEAILKIQGESLESWLGAEDAKTPAKIVEQAEEALQWAVKNRLIRCREDFEKKYQDPKKRLELIEASKGFGYWQWQGHILFRDSTDRHSCPACNASGLLSGTLWGEEVISTGPGWADYDPDGEWYGAIETVEKTFSVDEFCCLVCHLHVFGTREIVAAGLPEEFSRQEERERTFEEEYGND